MIFAESENQKKARELQRRIADNQQVYRRVFDTEDGKKVLADLEKRCFVHYTTMDANHGRMSFNEGRRSVFEYINGLLNRDLKSILEELTREEK